MKNKEIKELLNSYQENFTKNDFSKINTETLVVILPILAIIILIFSIIGTQIVFVYQSIFGFCCNFIYVMYVFYLFYKYVYLERTLDVINTNNNLDKKLIINDYLKNNRIIFLIVTAIIIIINIILNII